jgi:ribosome-associated protein
LNFIILAVEFSKEDLLPSISFKTSRSSGKGGQNVNKVSSKVELNFDLEASAVFDRDQKQRIRNKLAGRFTAGGMIQVFAEEDRSQYQNKERSIEKLYYLLKNALHEAKPRKATKPKREAIEKRLREKQKTAFKKISRGKKGYGMDAE